MRRVFIQINFSSLTLIMMKFVNSVENNFHPAYLINTFFTTLFRKPKMFQVLLLCEKENLAQLDRRSLRECGFNQIKIQTLGIEAARFLALNAENGEQVQLVICHERLADMRYDQFCSIIRTHPLLKKIPFLLIPDNSQEAGIEFLNKKFCGILQRPFSVDSLKKKINSLLAEANSVENDTPPNKDVDIQDFQRALESYGLLLKQEYSTDEYFHMGMGFLKDHNWQLAISAFEKSVQDHRLKAEAELGMAAAYKGSNDLLNFRQLLANAATSFVKSGRWNRGRNTYARLLQHDKSAKNPFLAEAHRYIKIGDYNTAGKIIQESLPLIPKGVAGSKLARLCFLASDQKAMIRALDEILASDDFRILKLEITHNLNLLNREREETERQKNAERKWELNRKISLARKEEEKIDSSGHPEIRQEEKIPMLDDDMEFEADISSSTDISEDEEDRGEENIQILAPLTRPEATSDLFSKKPKFNELLSVIKLTWKLARHSKKNG